MTSKEALEELIDTYISWRAYQTRECIENDYRYHKVLKDLDRLEKLEKTFDILKAVLDRVLIFKFKEDIISGGNIYISEIDSNKTTIVNLKKQEFDLLKEVL